MAPLFGVEHILPAEKNQRFVADLSLSGDLGEIGHDPVNAEHVKPAKVRSAELIPILDSECLAGGSQLAQELVPVRQRPPRYAPADTNAGSTEVVQQGAGPAGREQLRQLNHQRTPWLRAHPLQSRSPSNQVR